MPIVCFTACLYIVAVSRESLGVLTIIMGAMIHPIMVIPFGVFAKIISTSFEACLPNKLKKVIAKRNNNTRRVLSRLLTLTFNAYLSFVGAAMYYLFKSSVDYRKTSENFLVAMNDFKGLIFNKCICKFKSDGEHCINKDTNFQNLLSIVPNEIILLILMIFPMVCHVMHSFFTSTQSSTNLLDFIVGQKLTCADDETSTASLEMNQINVTEAQNPENDIKSITVIKKTDKASTKIFQWFCCFVSLLHVIGIIFIPTLFVYMFDIRERVAGKINQ